jgi:hypothetical protein
MDISKVCETIQTDAKKWPQGYKWVSLIVAGTQLLGWNRPSTKKESGGDRVYSPYCGEYLTGKVKRSYNGKQEYADYVNHPVHHRSGFSGPQSQVVFNKLKVNVEDATVTLNNPALQSRMGLTRKQTSPSNILHPLAKFTQQDGYLWSATQHIHPNDDAPDHDRLHWHLLIGINEERSTRLRQTEVYKTLKAKIDPLTYKTHATEKPVHCAIYGVFGKEVKDDPERLFLGTNNKQILSVLQQVKTHIVEKKKECLPFDESSLVDSAELVPETDYGIIEMIGQFVQEAVNGSEADLSDMLGGPSEEPATTEAEPSIFEGVEGNLFEPDAKKRKLGKVDYMIQNMQFCLEHNLFCQDDFNAFVSDHIACGMELPAPIKSMLSFDRNNKTILDRAAQMAYNQGIGRFLTEPISLDLGIARWIFEAPISIINAMMAWALVLQGKVPEKESNVYIHGPPNAGKSYLFGRPMIEMFRLVNCNLNQDKAFFANEMASYALMSVFDDITVTLKDMTCLEILKNILAKNQVELNTKYTSKEKSKNRPILFLNNCEFFDVIGELGDTKVHLDALHARFFFETTVSRPPTLEADLRVPLWKTVLSCAFLMDDYSKADFALVLADNPEFFKHQLIIFLDTLQASVMSLNSPFLPTAVSEDIPNA